MTVAATCRAAAPKTPPAPTETKSKTAVDYESFLKLLVAEMKNQDPTKPMESTDFVAQLATFSQVEQTVQSNTKLDQILQSTALSQAGSLIGREITSADGKTTGIISRGEDQVGRRGRRARRRQGSHRRRRRGHQGGGLTADERSRRARHRPVRDLDGADGGRARRLPSPWSSASPSRWSRR